MAQGLPALALDWGEDAFEINIDDDIDHSDADEDDTIDDDSVDGEDAVNDNGKERQRRAANLYQGNSTESG